MIFRYVLGRFRSFLFRGQSYCKCVAHVQFSLLLVYLSSIVIYTTVTHILNQALTIGLGFTVAIDECIYSYNFLLQCQSIFIRRLIIYLSLMQDISLFKAYCMCSALLSVWFYPDFDSINTIYTVYVYFMLTKYNFAWNKVHYS